MLRKKLDSESAPLVIRNARNPQRNLESADFFWLIAIPDNERSETF